MKMKIIDLLNKITNGEELPKKVKYNGVIFKNEDGDLLNDIYCSLFEHRGNECEKLLPMLNDEVEIIEEKEIPEKIDTYVEDDEKWIQVYNYGTIPLDKKALSNEELVIIKTLNQIIDYLKSKGDE